MQLNRCFTITQDHGLREIFQLEFPIQATNLMMLITGQSREELSNSWQIRQTTHKYEKVIKYGEALDLFHLRSPLSICIPTAELTDSTLGMPAYLI